MLLLLLLNGYLFALESAQGIAEATAPRIDHHSADYLHVLTLSESEGLDLFVPYLEAIDYDLPVLLVRDLH